MRQLHASSLMSLDGVVQDPGGFGETDQGGWALPYFDEEAVRDSMAALAAADTFLCGRVTYELLSRAWSGNTGPYPDMINAMPKLVASKTLSEPLTWNATVIDGDPVEHLTALKQRPGKDIVMYGSPTLMHTLMQHDLVDTFKVTLMPLVLGSGSRLFLDGAVPKTLDLVETKPLRSGAVMLTYRRGSAPA
ncbi:dihydrofolate reductase family protein [Labedaea rhizosphaerae]|uniref:Dihydrofolate reductase n=1 Tax=Labedaea rhizosphaerae TaxID=598644 RepID=A0A4R6RUY7_LABRH|nr:dihydrofolate reductase family protein [Labedaea rhizosphaerae]TDP89906.1 dihydrofolate reductase [Labedaea rhizosphaerae]